MSNAEALIDRYLDEGKKPRKGDKVKSPYAGRELKGGGKAPSHGVVKSVSGIMAYVDFGTGSAFTTIPVMDLQPAGPKMWNWEMAFGS